MRRIEYKSEAMPLNWDSWPHPASTQELGTEWLQSGESCLLMVPSAATHVDFNCLINPAHPDFRSIEVEPAKPMRFDDRLLPPRT
ncbi:MAG: RES family NAD+ phosphorylase [Planctomycetaceae bacterium]|nr:RES family NAD+ phosphorylase [Planctomycetaceae bacterium]